MNANKTGILNMSGHGRGNPLNGHSQNWKQPVLDFIPLETSQPPPLQPVLIGGSGRPVPLFEQQPPPTNLNFLHSPARNIQHRLNGNQLPPSLNPARIGAGVTKRNVHSRYYEDGNHGNQGGFAQHQKNQLKRLKDRIGQGVVRGVPLQEEQQEPFRFQFDLDRFHNTPSNSEPHQLRNTGVTSLPFQESRLRSSGASPTRASPSKGTKRDPIHLEEDEPEDVIAHGGKKPKKERDYICQLSHELKQFYHRNIQTLDVLHKKRELCNRLFNVARAAAETQYACNMFLVGSTLNGCASKSSDADLCLYLPNTDIDRKRTLLLLEKLRNRLGRSGQFMNIQLIRAKVPILKFRDRFTGFECDLNINNSVGIRNTHLLKAYSLVDERIAQLMFTVKYWARYNQINDASDGTFNSYSLALLVIFYLQVGVTPPIAPVLQKEEKEMFSLDVEVEQLPRFDNIPQKYKSSNPITVGELFAGFIQYFTSVFRFGTDIASIRTGRIIKRSSMDNDPQWTEKYICIEEPFDRSNTARAVYSQDKFDRVVQAFDGAWKRIQRERHFDCFSTARS